MVGVVLQEEAVLLVKIVLHMKVVVVAVANNEHNVLINLKDNKHRMNQVVSNKVVMHGEMNQEMIINQVVVFVAVVVDEVAEILKEAEAVLKEAEEVVVVEAVEISKAVGAEVVVVVAILVTEVLKKVHNSSNNNNSQHKKVADGNKVLSMLK